MARRVEVVVCPDKRRVSVELRLEAERLAPHSVQFQQQAVIGEHSVIYYLTVQDVLAGRLRGVRIDKWVFIAGEISEELRRDVRNELLQSSSH